MHWLACLALLRAVAHVLVKVDGSRSTEMKRRADALWKEWSSNRQQHSIFWDFVGSERNRLLKEGKFGSTPEPTYIITEHGEQIVTENGSPIVTGQPYYRMSLIGFEQKDGLELIEAAIEWWVEQLTKMEAELIHPSML